MHHFIARTCGLLLPSEYLNLQKLGSTKAILNSEGNKYICWGMRTMKMLLRFEQILQRLIITLSKYPRILRFICILPSSNSYMGKMWLKYAICVSQQLSIHCISHISGIMGESFHSQLEVDPIIAGSDPPTESFISSYLHQALMGFTRQLYDVPACLRRERRKGISMFYLNIYAKQGLRKKPFVLSIKLIHLYEVHLLLTS